jgi:hypothetical protein
MHVIITRYNAFILFLEQFKEQSYVKHRSSLKSYNLRTKKFLEKIFLKNYFLVQRHASYAYNLTVLGMNYFKYLVAFAALFDLFLFHKLV